MYFEMNGFFVEKIYVYGDNTYDYIFNPRFKNLLENNVKGLNQFSRVLYEDIIPLKGYRRYKSDQIGTFTMNYVGNDFKKFSLKLKLIGQ